MKMIRIYNVLIFSIYLLSCVPIQKEKKESFNTIENNKNLNDSTENKDIILEKDTLFSVFTSDMNYYQFRNTINEISKEHPNFLLETRKLGTSAIEEVMALKPGDIYYQQPCYVFNINNTRYLFDIIFNESDKISCYDTTLSLFVLRYEEKKQILLNDILNLYKSKYGQYTKNVKNEKHFIKALALLHNTEFEGKLASKTITETYTWKTKPTLQINYVKLEQLRNRSGWEIKPTIKRNTINIIYFSKEFNIRWEESEKQRIVNEKERLNKQKLSNREDI